MEITVRATYTLTIDDELAFREDGFRVLRQTQPALVAAVPVQEQDRVNRALAALMPQRVPTANGARFILREMSFEPIN